MGVNESQSSSPTTFDEYTRMQANNNPSDITSKQNYKIFMDINTNMDMDMDFISSHIMRLSLGKSDVQPPLEAVGCFYDYFFPCTSNFEVRCSNFHAQLKKLFYKIFLKNIFFKKHLIIRLSLLMY